MCNVLERFCCARLIPAFCSIHTQRPFPEWHDLPDRATCRSSGMTATGFWRASGYPPKTTGMSPRHIPRHLDTRFPSRRIGETKGIVAPPPRKRNARKPPQTPLGIPASPAGDVGPPTCSDGMPQQCTARRGAAERCLDRRLRMGYGRASGVYRERGPRSGPSGESLGGASGSSRSLPQGDYYEAVLIDQKTGYYGNDGCVDCICCP